VGRFNVFQICLLFTLFAVFLVFTLLVIFRRELVDNLVFGPLPKNDNAVIVPIDNSGCITVDVESRGNIGEIFLDLKDDFAITGVELFFEKPAELEITDFTCIAPFECVFFESDTDAFSVTMMMPISLLQDFSVGKIQIGEFKYFGEGAIHLLQESFVYEQGDSEMNPLCFDEIFFSL
jgi:hypothetical protein